MMHLIQNPSRASRAHTTRRFVFRGADLDHLLQGSVGRWQATPTSAGSASGGDEVFASIAAEAMKKARLLSSWLDLVLQPHAPADVDAIGLTVARVMDVIGTLGPEHLDLTKLAVLPVQPEHLVAVLRSSFMWRQQVPGWHEALASASNALERAGFRPEEVLVGLD